MNIDKLIRLGQEGKWDELEVERETLFQELIEKVDKPELRRKLNGLHFRVKNMKYRYKDPLVCCIKVNELMIESLTDLNEQIDKFLELHNESCDKN